MLKRVVIVGPMLLVAAIALLAGDHIIITQTSIDLNRDGQPDSIFIKMLSGRHYIDTELWCGAGEKYEGVFAIVVHIRGQKPVEHNLNVLFRGTDDPIYFYGGPWKIQFNDYNKDGQVDFNIGQYGACNGFLYKLFTVFSDGRIRRLKVPENHGLYVSDFANSTPEIRTTDTGFHYEWYNNAGPGTTREYYRWNVESQEFLHAKSVISGGW